MKGCEMKLVECCSVQSDILGASYVTDRAAGCHEHRHLPEGEREKWKGVSCWSRVASQCHQSSLILKHVPKCLYCKIDARQQV